MPKAALLLSMPVSSTATVTFSPVSPVCQASGAPIVCWKTIGVAPPGEVSVAPTAVALTSLSMWKRLTEASAASLRISAGVSSATLAPSRLDVPTT